LVIAVLVTLTFRNFHIYDCNLPYYDAGALNYWISVASSFGRPVWLTEFDCPNPSSAAMEIQWMQTALAALDSNPNVTRYAWFTARSTNYVGTIPSLLTSTIPTTLTPIGLFFNNAGDLLISPTQTTTGTTSTQSSSSLSSSNTGTSTSSNKGTSTSTSSNTGSKSSSSGSTTSSTTNSGSTSKSMTSVPLLNLLIAILITEHLQIQGRPLTLPTLLALLIVPVLFIIY